MMALRQLRTTAVLATNCCRGVACMADWPQHATHPLVKSARQWMQAHADTQQLCKQGTQRLSCAVTQQSTSCCTGQEAFMGCDEAIQVCCTT